MPEKSPEKPEKAQSPKRPKARKLPSAKARVLTSKPDPKAQEPSPARPNTTSIIPRTVFSHTGRSIGDCSVSSAKRQGQWIVI